MTRPTRLDIDLADVDPDGLADGNSSAGATLTLDGALTSGGTFTSADGLGRRISILDLGANDQSGATYTFTGTDSDGKAQTEDLAGPGASATVTTLKYFLTVTSVTIASPAATSTVDVGTVDEATSITIPLDFYRTIQPTVQVVVIGTINYDVETTLSDPLDTDSSAPFDFADQSDLEWVNDANLVNETTTQLNQLGVPGNRAMRVVVNSYTNAAELQVFLTQPQDI